MHERRYAAAFLFLLFLCSCPAELVLVDSSSPLPSSFGALLRAIFFFRAIAVARSVARWRCYGAIVRRQVAPPCRLVI